MVVLTLLQKSKIMGRKSILLILLLIIITPIGFLTKFYQGPAQAWVSDSLGGVFYEIFWCLVVAFIWPAGNPLKIALGVFVITCTLEFLQLWHPAFLEYLRNSFIGRTILGNSFNWMDFPYYVVGSLLGYLLLVALNIISKKEPENTS